MASSHRITRRHALQLGAATTALPLLHIRTAGAAGKLKIAFWDHWVPAGNAIMRKQVSAWAEKNKVDVEADFISGAQGNLQAIGVAEAQARSGHDVYPFSDWTVYNLRDHFAPVDDVVERLIAGNGAVDPTAEYLAKVTGRWVAVPTSSGSQIQPPCARISWMKAHGFDPVAAYPARPVHTALADTWTYDLLLRLAEQAQKENMTFGMGIGGANNYDGINQVGAMFHAFGADLVDRQGNILLNSPEVQQVMEYAAKLVKFLPENAVSYDDASNNRALISGKSALIFNPPSAWAVAKRDAPEIAADCWTFPAPAGPKGRFVTYSNWFWAVWSFSRNQSAGKELIEYLMQREQVEERDNGVFGYDIPPFAGLLDFKIWESVAPPSGTVYNYPMRPWHNARSSITAMEADPGVAVQIYQNAIHTGMLARLKSGQSIKQVLAWAEGEIRGYLI